MWGFYMKGIGISRLSCRFFGQVSVCALLVVSAFSMLSAPAFGQASPPAPAASSCDPDYYDTLESRAWLEAQREITQNQNLIFKPDSVLQYTCFDKHLGAVAQAAKGMFSEGYDLNTVASNARTFVDSNFKNDPDKMLGGRSNDSYALAGSVSEAAYSCDVMNNVWKEARCMNFIDEKDSDAFFTLKEYVDDSQDKRFKKGSCTKSANWGTENDALKVTKAGTTWTTGTGWKVDIVETFLDQFDPSKGCGPALETGIKVLPSLKSTSGYDEKFHLPPGCVYTAPAAPASP